MGECGLSAQVTSLLLLTRRNWDRVFSASLADATPLVVSRSLSDARPLVTARCIVPMHECSEWTVEKGNKTPHFLVCDGLLSAAGLPSSMELTVVARSRSTNSARLNIAVPPVKIRGGREWRDFTALTYHHETQPMPNPLSRQAHLLPRWFHEGEVLGNHFAQLVVPFFLFAPLLGLFPGAPSELVEGSAIVGMIAGGIILATQLWLVITGNFAWLNWATVVLAFSAFGLPGASTGSAAGSSTLAPVTIPEPVEGFEAFQTLPLYWLVITSAIGLLYVALSWPALRNLFARRQLMNASFNRWQLANAYGAFGTVTKERTEIVVEGTLSDDADPDAADWREYEFKGKPGDVRRVPRQFAPYHLRLDWLMWFLPLGHPLDDWFTTFLVRLLEADAPMLALLRHDPFEGQQPQWVRAVSYRYRLATRVEHRAERVVWVRDRRRVIVQPMRLRG